MKTAAHTLQINFFWNVASKPLELQRSLIIRLEKHFPDHSQLGKIKKTLCLKLPEKDQA